MELLQETDFGKVLGVRSFKLQRSSVFRYRLLEASDVDRIDPCGEPVLPGDVELTSGDPNLLMCLRRGMFDAWFEDLGDGTCVATEDAVALQFNAEVILSGVSLSGESLASIFVFDERTKGVQTEDGGVRIPRDRLLVFHFSPDRSIGVISLLSAGISSEFRYPKEALNFSSIGFRSAVPISWDLGFRQSIYRACQLTANDLVREVRGKTVKLTTIHGDLAREGDWEVQPFIMGAPSSIYPPSLFRKWFVFQGEPGRIVRESGRAIALQVPLPFQLEYDSSTTSARSGDCIFTQFRADGIVTPEAWDYEHRCRYFSFAAQSAANS